MIGFKQIFKKAPGESMGKTKLDFISLTAHQFKKPLSSMKVSLRMILNGDFGQITGEQRDVIEKIVQRNETLICLVDD